jgi:hypothetical protein
MPTRIVFAARGEHDLSIDVEEAPDGVQSALIGAGGQPFELTLASVDEKVWVNPGTVAYWHGTEPVDAYVGP